MNYKFIFSFLPSYKRKWRPRKSIEKTENLDTKIFKTKSGRLIMQSKCTECQKSRFVKEQEQKGY